MGGYVNETLRPRMFEILSKTHSVDNFIIEARSTTHVNLQVIKRFNLNIVSLAFRETSWRSNGCEVLKQNCSSGGGIDRFQCLH